MSRVGSGEKSGLLVQKLFCTDSRKVKWGWEHLKHLLAEHLAEGKGEGRGKGREENRSSPHVGRNVEHQSQDAICHSQTEEECSFAGKGISKWKETKGGVRAGTAGTLVLIREGRGELWPHFSTRCLRGQRGSKGSTCRWQWHQLVNPTTAQD
jgi:hypothetical protein